MIGIVYINEAGGDIVNLLRTNFLIMLLAIGYFGLLNLWRFSWAMMDVGDLQADDSKWNESPKWGFGSRLGKN